MSTLYQSSKDVPTEVLAARLNELADVVARKRDRIGDEFTMRIPAECDRDADLVMSEAAVRLEALQAECEKLRREAELWESIHDEIHRRADKEHALADRCDFDVTIMYEDYAAIDTAMQLAPVVKQ